MLPATTHIGCVTLRVASLEESLRFYEGLLGLTSRSNAGGSATLHPKDEAHALVQLVEYPGAKSQPVRAAGLFHTAFLLPTRRDLGLALLRLSENHYPLQGGSDHAVSEALYLSDPDGNGVEIYADRPRDQWPRANGGEIAMTTAQLDVEGLLREAETGDERTNWGGFPVGTRVGHIHLRVPSIERFRQFLLDTLEFDLISARYPGALFVSAGGYHHHVAANVWEGTNVPPLPSDAAGLVHFEVVVPETPSISAIGVRAEQAGLTTNKLDNGIAIETDGIRVHLVERQQQ